MFSGKNYLQAEEASGGSRIGIGFVSLKSGCSSRYELRLQMDAWQHLQMVYEQLAWENCKRLAKEQLAWLEEQSLLMAGDSLSAEQRLWTSH